MDADILALPNGADFVKADLHIHSFGFDDGSFDVKDATMTPQNIVDTAIAKGLKIISITDHNEIGNSKIAIDYAKGKNILVVPGIEVSTTQGHLLVYFQEFTDLRKFHGNLNIAANKETCSQGIVNCLDIAKANNGFGILAHIELDSGFEKTIARFGPPIEEVFKHEALLGLEISNKASAFFYTDKDSVPERKALNQARITHLGYQENYRLAKVMSSDAHALSKLGLNAEGERKLTRIKVDSLSFHSLKVALIHPSSRIRIEGLVPEQFPKIEAIKIQGGLLAGQHVKFSSNLNCIIGGRGTGKSTMLESIISCTGNSTNSGLLDSDVWPESVTLFCKDDAGQILEFSRDKNGHLVNRTSPETGILHFPIEYYGQGAATSTIQNSDTRPDLLLDFLDNFLEIDPMRFEEKALRESLISNQSKQQELRIEVKQIPDISNQIQNLLNKLESLKTEGVRELVENQEALLKEGQFRIELVKDLNALIKTYKEALNENAVFENIATMDETKIIVGKNNFAEVRKIVADFQKLVQDTSTTLQADIALKVDSLTAELIEWKTNESLIQKKIDDKKKELEIKGIPFDLGKINQIINDLAKWQGKLKELKKKEEELTVLRKERLELLGQRIKMKGDLYRKRQALANDINDSLKESIEGLQVRLKYEQGRYSPLLEDWIKGLMDYRTSAVPKAQILARSMDPLELATLIQKNDLNYLLSVKDANGAIVFGKEEVDRILAKFRENQGWEDIQQIEYEDRPKILVTRITRNEDGTDSRSTRTISQLSLGQQQSILLAILLHSKSNKPMIIDQPEDNLDNEFIYKTIVSNLRKLKETRQVIIVTHNPNIAVLGDAELILPLKSTSTRSMIQDRGSIDNEGTRKLTCEILEGGKQAFIRRKEIYGI